MYRVGLTGGIASGKSTVARLFQDEGITLVDADRIAHEVVERGTPGLAQVVAAFGPQVLTDSGDLDRSRVRDLVFADVERRRQLEAIIHPLVRQEMARQVAAAQSPYTILDIPLLVESSDRASVDRVLVVDLPDDVQRQRLAARDGLDDRVVDQILAAQASRYDRLAVADDVVDNSGPRESLAPQVLALHERYLLLAQCQEKVS
ncbi:MAG: dephospho-CoA kinase [Pseudomonadota bacterium]